MTQSRSRQLWWNKKFSRYTHVALRIQRILKIKSISNPFIFIFLGYKCKRLIKEEPIFKPILRFFQTQLYHIRRKRNNFKVEDEFESFYSFVTHRLDIVLEQHVTQIGAALVALDVQLSLEIKSAKIYWLMHFPFPSASANFTIVSRPRKVGRASNFPEQPLEAPVHVQRPFRSDTPLTTPLFSQSIRAH